MKLLQRTTRRVTVTPEGAACYERTARVLAELEDIESDLSSAQANPRGWLRVAVVSSLGNMILIPQLPAFHARYPEIELDVGVSDRPVNLIGDAVDCVIRAGELNNQSLVARRIATLPFVTCATPDYLRRHGVPKTPADRGNGTHRVYPLHVVYPTNRNLSAKLRVFVDWAVELLRLTTALTSGWAAWLQGRLATGLGGGGPCFMACACSPSRCICRDDCQMFS